MNLENWIKNRLGSGHTKKESEPDKPIIKSTKQIIKEEVELMKAIHDNDWKNISLSHDEKQLDTIDHTYHTVNSKSPDKFSQYFYDQNKIHEAIPTRQVKGISEKTIHKMNDDHYMIKPYYPVMSHIRSVPLAGWSIMASKNLYNEAGINHLIEDVGSEVLSRKNHNNDNTSNIPVTVHKFAKGYSNAADLPMFEYGQTAPSGTNQPKVEATKTPIEYNVNPLHAMQIGLMDYLTGNHDRHGNNLLVGNEADSTGYKPLLAIDHDRSFNYQNHIYSIYQSQPYDPSESYKESAIYKLFHDKSHYSSENTNSQIASWWKQKNQAVYDEMNRNLNSVKDHHLRRFLRSNFEQRYQAISSWADNYAESKQPFFERKYDKSIPMHKVDDDTIQKIKKELPSNKLEAINMVLNQMKQPRGEDSREAQYAMDKVASDIINDMNPRDIVKVFSRVDSDDRILNFKYNVLQDMRTNPEKNIYTISSLLEVNELLPKDSRFLNDFWVSQLQRSLDKAKSSGVVA